MIDTNVSIGTWPFRKLPGDDVPSVVAHLQRNGVTEAWTGNLDGLFHRDIDAVNRRLAEACRKAPPGLLVPFGTVNPAFPDWEEDFRRCIEVHKFRGIRLHPAFHGYNLAQPEFVQLLTLAAESNLIVQIVTTMEDERTQHPIFRVPTVDLAPLKRLSDSIPSLRLIILNAFRKLPLDQASQLAASQRVWFDIAMLEGVDRLAALVDQVGPKQILFGSHFPLFYIESVSLKLHETQIPSALLTEIQFENARRIIQQ